MTKRAFDPYPPELAACRLCSRLVAWREQVARVKRRAYLEWEYWGRPLPGFGDPAARICMVGLSPGAHGANRTGRMFTGDASGAFLFPALHRCGFADRPTTDRRDDGLELRGLWVTSALRCVPPKNVPTSNEIRTCRRWLAHDLDALDDLAVVIGMGKIGHDAYLDLLTNRGQPIVKLRYKFAHGARYEMPDGTVLLDTYHVSLRNTNSKLLTPDMLDKVLRHARSLAGLPDKPPPGNHRDEPSC
ncbi:uracil-DNA glycosylase [bacterium]|nr:uracil-DNA glycosylase [bacterium]